MRVLIYVQHLLGIGHLQRALQLAEGLAQAGFSTDLVSGGMPSPLSVPAGVQLHQLPPVRCVDGRFDRLLDDTENEIDAHWKERRRAKLIEIFDSVAPEVLITETFPFGRRMLRFELLPLLEAARTSDACRLVVASIRDILQPKARPERNSEIVDLIESFYDRVLVHGDARLAPLELSFAETDAIADKIGYSGYIRRSGQAPSTPVVGNREVLVSAGGSATGLALLRAAIAARPLSVMAGCAWRILVSPAIDAADFSALQASAMDGIIVERNRSDFPALLHGAALSISQAGYNTVTDLLSVTTPAVLVPYAEADEIEQSLRAGLLQRHGRAIMLAETGLNGPALAQAVDQALRLKIKLPVKLDGAAESARLIRHWLAEARQKR